MLPILSQSHGPPTNLNDHQITPNTQAVSANEENVNQTLILTQNNLQISQKRKKSNVIQCLFQQQFAF